MSRFVSKIVKVRGPAVYFYHIKRFFTKSFTSFLLEISVQNQTDSFTPERSSRRPLVPSEVGVP